MNKELKRLAEDYFPKRLLSIALADAEGPEPTEEIRITAGGPLAVVKKSGLYFLSEAGATTDYRRAAFFSIEEVRELLLRLCRQSIYSSQEQLRQGFIALSGGHRAGVAGRCVAENGKIKYITDVSAITIRIAHEVIGAAEKLLPYVVDEPVRSMLILSPPGCGKTTMLRDMARALGSERFMKKVAIVDERGEIAACFEGQPRNTIGALTAVLDNCPKAEGIMALLRAMAPEVIITDEIGSEEDACAIEQAVLSGVAVICSAHGKNVREAMQREALRTLIHDKVFDHLVVLSRKSGAGTVEEIAPAEAYA